MRALLAVLMLLVAGVAEAATVNLTWTPPTKMSDGSTISGPITYRVYRATSAAGIATATAIATTPAGVSGFQDTAAPAGDLWYAVSAIVGGVEGAKTNAVTINVPAPTPNAPTGLTLSVVVADNTVYKLRQGIDGFAFVAIGKAAPNTQCDVRTASDGVSTLNVIPRSAVTLTSKFDTLPLITFAKCA